LTLTPLFVLEGGHKVPRGLE